MNGIILFAHGARDPAWAVPFNRLQHLVAAQHPDSHVGLAYLELMSPSLPTAVATLAAQGVSGISIVPLFLGPGAHLRQDFPRLVSELQAQYPQIPLVPLPAMGESEALLHGIAEWIAHSLPDAPA